jgi:hypothetical protein
VAARALEVRQGEVDHPVAEIDRRADLDVLAPDPFQLEHVRVQIGGAFALPAHLRGEAVPRLLDLAGMAEQQPGAAEDALHLQVEQRGVGADRAVRPIRLDQRGDGRLGPGPAGPC